jgi:hypothetical protein
MWLMETAGPLAYKVTECFERNSVMSFEMKCNFCFLETSIQRLWPPNSIFIRTVTVIYLSVILFVIYTIT